MGSEDSTLQQGFYYYTSTPQRILRNLRNTMIFLLFLTFYLQQTSAECPEAKTVGDTCYTRVEFTDTSQYGCHEGCTYRKTMDEESRQLYCFKKGGLPVTESNCTFGLTDDPNKQVTVTNNLNKDVTMDVQCQRFLADPMLIPDKTTIPLEICGTVTISGRISLTQDTCGPAYFAMSYKNYDIVWNNNPPPKCVINPRNPHSFFIDITNNFGKTVYINIFCRPQTFDVRKTPPYNKKNYTPCQTVDRITAIYDNGAGSCTSSNVQLKNFTVKKTLGRDTCKIV